MGWLSNYISSSLLGNGRPRNGLNIRLLQQFGRPIPEFFFMRRLQGSSDKPQILISCLSPKNLISPPSLHHHPSARIVILPPLPWNQCHIPIGVMPSFPNYFLFATRLFIWKHQIKKEQVNFYKVTVTHYVTHFSPYVPL